MRVVSSIDFHNDTDKYLDLAENEQVLIQRGNDETFILEKQVYLEPDDDFRSALSAEEFKTEIHKHIDQLYSQKDEGHISASND